MSQALRNCGATLVGQWATDSYEFCESLALEDGKFLGLGIDEVNQPELTAERVKHWVSQLIAEFKVEVQ